MGAGTEKTAAPSRKGEDRQKLDAVRLVAAGPRLLFDGDPVADLHCQAVLPRCSDRARKLWESDEPSPLTIRPPILRPHQEQRAARPPLPAEHGVAAERQHVEVGIADRPAERAVFERDGIPPPPNDAVRRGG